jgi:4-amino-4-deoxy-L-arabinose transferase-like glycosyltransferase
MKLNDASTRTVLALGEQRWQVFLVFFLALTLRLLNLRESGDNPLMYFPVLDEAYYIELGRKIAGGFWLGEDRPFFMDPLYGYFLGAVFRFFGDNLLIVRILQILLDSLSAVLIYVLGTKTWSRTAGFLGGVIYALYRVAFFHDLLVLKTTLTVTMPLLFLLLLLHTLERPAWTKWLLLGTFNGVMVYLWASFLLIAPLTLIAYWVLNRPRWPDFGLQGILFACGMAVLLGAGALRNYTVAGEVVFLNTQGGRLQRAFLLEAPSGAFRRRFPQGGGTKTGQTPQLKRGLPLLDQRDPAVPQGPPPKHRCAAAEQDQGSLRGLRNTHESFL